MPRWWPPLAEKPTYHNLTEGEKSPDVQSLATNRYVHIYHIETALFFCGHTLLIVTSYIVPAQAGVLLIPYVAGPFFLLAATLPVIGISFSTLRFSFIFFPATFLGGR